MRSPLTARRGNPTVIGMSDQTRIDMRPLPRFGAGLWHFGRYVDRYATDGYGPPINTLEAIDLAGQVDDLSVVDLTYPFDPADLPVETVAEALSRNDLRAIAHDPGDLHPAFLPGRVHQSRRRHPARGHRPRRQGRRGGQDPGMRLRQVVARPGRMGLPVPGRPRRSCGNTRLDAVRELATTFSDLRFAIEYKPREPA